MDKVKSKTWDCDEHSDEHEVGRSDKQSESRTGRWVKRRADGQTVRTLWDDMRGWLEARRPRHRSEKKDEGRGSGWDLKWDSRWDSGRVWRRGSEKVQCPGSQWASKRCSGQKIKFSVMIHKMTRSQVWYTMVYNGQNEVRGLFWYMNRNEVCL